MTMGAHMNDLEISCFIAAPAVFVLFGLILILISEITRPDPWESPNPPRHLVPITVQHAEVDVITGVIDDLETYPQVGRRGRYSAARNMRVADDWTPYIGDRLVTILLQSTAEFMFVRQPRQQLTDPFIRAQWATSIAELV